MTRFEILDRNAVHVATHVRYDRPGEPKTMFWERDGETGLGGLPTADLPLFGIHLIHTHPVDTPVIVTEGEKAAAALISAGYCAVGTVTGAAGCPGDAAVADLRGRDVVVWPDNDGPGRQHMEQLARRLQGVARSVRIAEWREAPPKGDAADFLLSNVASGVMTVITSAVQVTPGTPSPAQPARPAWPEAITVGMHGLAGEFVTEAAPCTEGDPNAMLVALLTAAGVMIGPSIYAMAGDAVHPARLNSLVVGETARGRKGTAVAAVMRLLQRANPAFASSMAAGLSTGEGLIYCVRDGVEEYQEVGKDRHRELVVLDAGVSDKRLLVSESEFARVLKVARREGNTLSPVIRLAWDTGDLRTMTRNQPIRATGAHIGIIGQITRDELLRLLDETDLASGLANRFLFVAARRSQLLPEGGCVPESILIASGTSLRTSADWAQIPRELRRNAAATELWDHVYRGLAGDEQVGLREAVTSRAEAQVLRLSVLLAALDRSPVITTDHITAALDVWRYCDESAGWVFGDVLGDPVADGILQALSATAEMTRNDLHDFFGKHVKSDALGRALAMLVNRGRITMAVRQTGGRPAEVYCRVQRG